MLCKFYLLLFSLRLHNNDKNSNTTMLEFLTILAIIISNGYQFYNPLSCLFIIIPWGEFFNSNYFFYIEGDIVVTFHSVHTLHTTIVLFKQHIFLAFWYNKIYYIYNLQHDIIYKFSITKERMWTNND